MRGSSQHSRDAVMTQFEPVATAAGKAGVTLATQLFAVVDALDSSGSLRRALTDPARLGAAKAELVEELFAKSDQRVRDVVTQFANARWSGDRDLAEAIEDAGVAALLASAQADGSLEAVEDELFHVERTLAVEREARVALDDRTAPVPARLALLETIFGKRTKPVTMQLLARAVASPRGRRLSVALREFSAAAATRRGRAVAHVTAAVELSAAQRKRLAGILTDAYGREVQLNVAIDPAVVGGLRIQVGDEVVDGTVQTKLDEARRRLVG